MQWLRRKHVGEERKKKEIKHVFAGWNYFFLGEVLYLLFFHISLSTYFASCALHISDSHINSAPPSPLVVIVQERKKVSLGERKKRKKENIKEAPKAT